MSDQHKEDEILDKLFETVRGFIPEGDKASVAAVEPIIRQCLHVAGHLAVAARLHSPEYVKLCMEEYIEATHCIAAQMAEDMFKRIFEARAEVLPEEDKN